MKLFDVVELAEDLPAEGLTAGAQGTIVEVYEQPEPAYEVEFSAPDGSTVAILALRPGQLTAVAAG